MPARKTSVHYLFALILLLFCTAATVVASERWSAKLDGKVRFYQSTELGVLVVGTEKSLYAVDGETGDVLWRRKNVKLDETDVAPVPGTDLVLLTLESGSKSRVEALDLMTGEPLWRSDKVRGAVMQMALDQNANLLGLVLVRDAKGKAKQGFKRKPVLHVLNITNGEELWKRELESEVEMMPARWGDTDDVPYTLDNYRPPVFLDNRLYVFYEGLTSLDAQTGRERQRDKFRVNEDGLALTESDPAADERNVYTSGRGKVRAISRLNGEEVWEAKDLGSVPEMLLTRDVLYARTGGQFARLEDGETVERGPYGVSAIDLEKGRVLWRYKGADKGITNVVMPDAATLVMADRDDLIIIDAQTGKRRTKISHKVEKAAFVLLNERGEAVVGGKNEIAAFDLNTGANVWRSRHNPPGRGLLRTVAAVAARAAALYFRYGSAYAGVASTAFRGVQLLNTLNGLRSGLTLHSALPSLTTLASNKATEYARNKAVEYARNKAGEYARDRIAVFGMLARVRETSTSGLPTSRPRVTLPRPSVQVKSGDVEDRLLEKLDPAHQLERLSRILLRTRRLAALRGDWMYFYTDLGRGNGLLGVNVNTGADERSIRMSAPDDRFISDDVVQLLFVSQDNRLLAYALSGQD
ncbi:MAG TPA: PQQ-binding-like beta-propeller repeat protein [Pyrinomonadaceae bacterium]|nr:PQQ-binding-like beta-propeller repeat protein [Pyrinomonadaceae bacterium]